MPANVSPFKPSAPDPGAELTRLFSPRVAELVRHVTEEDKCAAWEVRKQRYLEHFVVKPWEAQAITLADKIDTLVSFWAIDEKPTGSKDPYALRRAALGAIRLLLENELRLSLIPVFSFHSDVLDETKKPLAHERGKRQGGDYVVAIASTLVEWSGKQIRTNCVDLLVFFAV